jgi:type IV secretion system protein VirD4
VGVGDNAGGRCARGLTLWIFWQNLDQLKIYGAQANTIVDNAGVIQIFGARNRPMAKDLSDIVGSVTARRSFGHVA